MVFTALVVTVAAETAGPRLMRVGVPVLDVRSTPARARGTSAHDPAEETQLLYGELVQIEEARGGWARIEALEQPEWTHHKRWEGYPGWVETEGLVDDDPQWLPDLIVVRREGVVRVQPNDESPILVRLSLGSYLSAVGETNGWWHVQLLNHESGWIAADLVASRPRLQHATTDDRRQQILSMARELIGEPYYWGGRSTRVGARGIDCSGFVNLCYRAAEVAIPRDAHEQFMRARAIDLANARPGDLIFLADPNNPQRMTHVMLSVGGSDVIEAPGTGQRVRQIPLEEKLRAAGRGRRVACGTFFL